MGMNIHIRVKNDVAYGDRIGENSIDYLIDALGELKNETGIDFV